MVDDILARKAIKPRDLMRASALSMRKLGKSEADHWLAYIEKTSSPEVARSGVVHSLIDLIVQASLGSKASMYVELRRAIDYLSQGIDPELTKQKLAQMSEVERQTIEQDLRLQKTIEDEATYKIAVRREAIKAVFG